MKIFNDDLKPCPFCGATIHDRNGVRLNTIEMTNKKYTVACSCGANGSIKNSVEKAKKAWNNSHSSNEVLSWNPFRAAQKSNPSVLKGDLATVNISSILQFLSSEKKTGILQIAGGKRRGAIYLKDGNMVAASCNWGRQLGTILLENGLVSQERLQNSLVRAKKAGKTVGEVLLSLGDITNDALIKAIRFQIREVVMDIIYWTEGKFQYRDGTVNFDKRGVEEISTVAILLEATIKNDELNAA
jgi:Lar family restriction alleviation protein